MATAQIYLTPNSVTDMTIPLARIRPSGFNPRKRFDEESLLELADSIREHGLLEPIVVRPIAGALLIKGDTYLYEIVAGERRYRACIMAGLEAIPCRVHNSLDDATALRLAIVENVQRQDLDPLEEAEGYRALAQLGMRQREIAEAVKRSQPAIANTMRLLDLPAGVQAKIRAGALSGSHGIALASYKANSHVQEELAEMATKENWPCRKLERFFADIYYLPDGLKKYVYEMRGFQLSECRGSCPHDAYRASENSWMGWCLRPACYEEKARAAKEAAEEATLAKIEQARASGSTIVRTSDLGAYDGDGYHTINTWTRLPEGCQAECPKRVKALGAGNLEVEICSDAKCWRRLEMAVTRKVNKAGRNRAKELLGEIERAVDGLQLFGVREMAVIAALALSDGDLRGKILDETCERQDQAYLARVFRDDHWDRAAMKETADWNRFEVLAGCSMLELAKIILEVAIRKESQNLSENPGWDRATPIADWYLGAHLPAKGEATE